MSTIYRVENSCGQGPYTGGGITSYDSERQPPPCDDGLVGPYDGLFGFASLEALERWFDENERLSLVQQGFNIVVYTNAVVIQTGHSGQVVFRKPKIVFVEGENSV